MACRCAGLDRVRVVAGEGDEGMVRVRRVNRDTADEAGRGARRVDAGEGHRVRIGGVGVLGDEETATACADPHRARVTRGARDRDCIAAGLVRAVERTGEVTRLSWSLRSAERLPVTADLASGRMVVELVAVCLEEGRIAAVIR